MKKNVIAIIVVILAVAGVIAVVVMKSKDDNKVGQASSAADASNANNSNADTSNNPSSGNANTGSEAASPVATSKVDIKSYAFAPGTITVKKGTAVTWSNSDDIEHTVTGDEDGGPHSQPLKKGDTYTFTFNNAGTFAYHCVFHSNMTGKVVVME